MKQVSNLIYDSQKTSPWQLRLIESNYEHGLEETMFLIYDGRQNLYLDEAAFL